MVKRSAESFFGEFSDDAVLSLECKIRLMLTRVVFSLVTAIAVSISPFVILLVLGSAVLAQDAAAPDRVAMEGWLLEIHC
jgi:hypothetical protein